MMDAGEFKPHQAWLALRDPQTWLLVLYTFCVNLWNGGVTSVRSQSLPNHDSRINKFSVLIHYYQQLRL
jgi:hypothetical protein